MSERQWVKLRVISDKVNGARRGDIIELDDLIGVEYLIASGQCERVQDEKPATKPDKKPSKLGRRRNKE